MIKQCLICFASFLVQHPGCKACTPECSEALKEAAQRRASRRALLRPREPRERQVYGVRTWSPRPRKLSDEQVGELIERRRHGVTLMVLARDYKMARQSITELIDNNGYRSYLNTECAQCGAGIDSGRRYCVRCSPREKQNQRQRVRRAWAQINKLSEAMNATVNRIQGNDAAE